MTIKEIKPKTNHFLKSCLWLMIISFQMVSSQINFTTVPITQQDSRIHVGLQYQTSNDALLGAFTQDYKITVQNKTNDKLHVYVDFYVSLVCGKQKQHQFAPLGDGFVLKPSESINPTYISKDFGYKRLLYDDCSKDTWRFVGVDKSGNKNYTIINSMGYNVVKIINLSELERQKEEASKKKKEDEVGKQKELEEKKKKEAADKKKKEDEANEKKTVENNSSDFWSDTPVKKSDTQNSSASKNENIQTKDPNFFKDSSFKDGLSDVKEGEYFKDGNGGFYQKVDGGARIVDKSTYDKSQADKIYAGIEKRQNESKQREAAFNQMSEQVVTSFYNAQNSNNAHTNMKDAANLRGDFQSLEQLNQAFSLQMSGLKEASQEMRTTSQAAMSSYTASVAARATTTSDQTYSAALGALGSMVSSIAANNEEKKAREELNRQREAQEAKIRESQRAGLVGIRNQIDKSFKEGGMPLSSHKVTAPVLYLFAFSIDKRNWEKDVEIPLVLSNVIPVYKYSDGTYPYLSNVKKTFENAGVTAPKIIGYFTEKSQAETYRKGLIDVAPGAKFSLSKVEVKVKEKSNIDAKSSSSDADFWGNPTTDKKTTTEIKEEKKQDDFWDK